MKPRSSAIAPARRPARTPLATIVPVVLLLAACSSSSTDDPSDAPQTPAGPAAGTAPAAVTCATLAAQFSVAGAGIDSATPVAAGGLTLGGAPVPSHCLVTGHLNSRTGADGNPYAIRFEMRLPDAWNGRFYYQANGGLDGAVLTAQGALGGGPLTGALMQGFATLSSDAGHTSAQNATFGFEPQARLDYGYQAAAALTPLGKGVVSLRYGRAPSRSYFGGCSNGGRHTLVATTRLADQYDGFLAGDPGYNLPKAAVAQIWSAQQFATIATPGATTTAPAGLGGATIPDLSSGFTAAERATTSAAILKRCDALDGAADGIVSDVVACQTTFDVGTDVPDCAAQRDGTCLTAPQKRVLKSVFAGARTTAGAAIYSDFPFDPGVSGSNWASWKFINSLLLDPVAAGTVFSVPPAAIKDPLAASVDALNTAISATSATYTQSALQFMTPPNAADLSVLKNRGAKVIVYHGTADPVFSYSDSVAWYQRLAAAQGGDASSFARLFGVPGMNHCSGGPATDQFDLLSPLVAWVERGEAPDRVMATARGAGNAGGVNAELPAGWSATRTRPLCPYPKVARYAGSGSLEDAASFTCQ